MLDLKCVAFRKDDEAFVGPARRHRIDGERHDIKVDARRADDRDLVISDRCLSNARHGIFHIQPRQRWSDRPYVAGVDEPWLGDQSRTQRTFLRQKIERVTAGAGLPMLAYGAHDVGQCLVCRTIAVQQPERFAIVGANADL